MAQSVESLDQDWVVLPEDEAMGGGAWEVGAMEDGAWEDEGTEDEAVGAVARSWKHCCHFVTVG